MVSKVPQNILERGQKKVQKKEEKASMAIEKQMGDAAAGIAAANSTKGLLPSSLTVTYLTRRWRRRRAILPCFGGPLFLQYCSTRKEEAFIGWMSSAALMAVEQKKARNGRGPLQPLQLTRATMSRLAAKWLSAAAVAVVVHSSSVSHKGQKRLFFCSAGRSSQPSRPAANG